MAALAILDLRHRWADGTTRLVFDPIELRSPIDGRFLTVKRTLAPAGVTNVSVVLNWFAELRRQLPR